MTGLDLPPTRFRSHAPDKPRVLPHVKPVSFPGGLCTVACMFAIGKDCDCPCEGKNHQIGLRCDAPADEQQEMLL